MGASDGASAEAWEVAREVAAIVRRVTGDPTYRVFLFGSWAEGNARERSDVDVAVQGPAPLDPALMQDVREACERLPTLYTIDLVDLRTLPDGVRDNVLAHAVELEGSGGG
jgi:predicted nucleotidyltransferase